MVVIQVTLVHHKCKEGEDMMRGVEGVDTREPCNSVVFPLFFLS